MADWPSKEEDLRAPVRAYLEDQGYTVRDEVWINGRIADLFAYDGDETLAVELKLTDLDEAIVQSMAYQLGALYTYVAMPVVHAPRVMRRSMDLRSRRIGLLVVAPGQGEGFKPANEPQPERPGKPDVRELIEPKPSERFLPFLSEKIVSDAERPKRVWTSIPRDV